MRVARVRQLRSEGHRASGAGLEGQRRTIAAACKRRGWRLLELAEEADRSATDRKRPGIEEALPVLKRGDAQALVAAKRERLSQALLDLASLLASAQKQGWALVALDCTLEPTTPTGEQVANLLATFAPCERRLISRRTRAALARTRAQGVRLGRPPTISPYGLGERNGSSTLRTRPQIEVSVGGRVVPYVGRSEAGALLVRLRVGLDSGW